MGLFGQANSATLRDVTVSNASITANLSSRAGVLVGYAESSQLSNIHVTGTVTAYQEAGGIAGWLNDSKISNSSSAASVTVSANGAGGLAGYVFYSGDISDSYATGSVTAASDAGGLIGQNFSVTSLSLTNVYASGRVTGTSAGGLIGAEADPTNPSTITFNNAFWDGDSTDRPRPLESRPVQPSTAPLRTSRLRLVRSPPIAAWISPIPG